MASFVAHIDADCFYVSAERVRFPYLKGMPVGVLSNQGAFVIAKSYEMKKLGIKTGESIWDAKEKCPEGIYLKRDFEWYGVISHRLLENLQPFSPWVEYYSIDEFFVRFDHLSANDLYPLAERIRNTLQKTTGVPVSIGMGRTRTLAKLGSDSSKPNGICVLPDVQAEEKLLANLPLTEISGIGQRRANRVAPYGIKTCLDFIRAQGNLIRKLLTKTGFELWQELQGTSVFPVRTQRTPHQTISRGGSTKGTISDPSLVLAWLVRHLERLISELEDQQVVTHRLIVYLMYTDGTGNSGEGYPEVPTDRFDLLLPAAKTALRKAWQTDRPITRLHLLADQLQRGADRQWSLFCPHDPRLEQLAKTKRMINRGIGRFTVRSGATLPLYQLYHDPTENFDLPDIKGKFCF